MRRIQARTGLLVLALVTLLLVASVALAQVSANHTLSWHVIAGGGGRMESAGHTLLGTAGQPLVGSMSSNGHTLGSGFWGEGDVSSAISGTRYVALDGTDSGDCSTIAGRCRTIQYAVDVAAPNDRILVAGGTFTSTGGTVASIAKPLAITGGYAPDFGTLDLGAYQTVLDAQWGGSVVSVTNAVSVSLDHLTLTHGDGTDNCGSGGCGGGIYVAGTSLHVGGCVITDNVGSWTGQGWGGGIYGYNSNVDVWGSQIVNNIANADLSSSAYGSGGGIHVYFGAATLRENQILDNAAHVSFRGDGGGIYLREVTHTNVLSNVIQGNRAVSGTVSGYGGGIFAYSALSLYVADNRIENNWTNKGFGGQGGGVYLDYSEAHLARNVVLSNTAAGGGGIQVQGSGPVTLSNNLIAHNHATARGDGVYVIYTSGPASQAILVNNTIADNGNTGVAGWERVVLTMTNNLIAGHATGIITTVPASATIAADTNLFWNDSDSITGTNAILENPLLTADYHLGEGSPAIDAGLTIPWLTTDLAGTLRPQGSGYDIGAYEGAITNTAPTAAFIVNPTSGYTSTIFSFDASGCSDAEDQSPALQVRWDWEDDGSYDTAWSTIKAITHTYTAVGTYTVRLEVQDTGGLTDTTTHQVAVRGGTVDYRIFLPLVQRN